MLNEVGVERFFSISILARDRIRISGLTPSQVKSKIFRLDQIEY